MKRSCAIYGIHFSKKTASMKDSKLVQVGTTHTYTRNMLM